MNNLESEINKYLETIGQNYSKFLICYNLFQLDNKSRAPNVIGQEEAEKNVKIINKYNSIFTVLGFGMIDLAIFELSKIFEKQNPKYGKTVSLIILIDFLKDNKVEINSILKNQFAERCNILKEGQLNFLSMEEIINEEGGEKILDDLFFKQIDTKISNIGKKVKYLKNARDNRGHNLGELKVTKLTYDDLDKIKNDFLYIFNLINSYLGKGINDYSSYYTDTENHFMLLLNDLKNYDKIRNLFFDNFLNGLGKTDSDIYDEIKDILEIDF